jgi:polyisoprenyl-phosphate glycosyltransferase
MANHISNLAARMSQPRLSCVIPCYNEAKNLALLLPVLAEQLNRLSPNWEVVLVDDGSRDETSLVLANWAQKSGFRALLLSRNFGKEAALSAGLQAARGDAVILMDGDLQHTCSLIDSFVAHWQNGADVVYAVRENRRDEGAIKRLGTRLFYSLMNSADRFTVPPGAGDFRLMDRRVVEALLSLPERNRFMKGLYAWVGFEAVAVLYVPEQRVHGRTSYSLSQLLSLSLAGLTAFTTWPLRAVSVTGFVLAMCAFVYGTFLTASYFLGGADVSGWTTIVVSLMLFSGIQMISLGIVGEYIGRVFEEVKGRPLFIVKQELGEGLPKRPQPDSRV